LSWKHTGLLTFVTTCLLLCAGCGGSSVDSEGVSVGASPDASQDIPGEYVAILGPDLAGQLANIQIAIDTVVESEVVTCMSGQNFEYEPRSQKELMEDLEDVANAPMLSYAENALLSLFAEENEAVSPNQALLNELSPAEQDAWLAAETQCFVDVSHAHTNPTALGGSWYAEAYTLASQRTGADPRVMAAEHELSACVAQTGYGTMEEAYQYFYEETAAILADLESGTITREEARTALTGLAVQEAEASRLLQDCFAPLQAVQREVFTENMSAIAAEEADRAALWAAEIEDLVASYVDYLPAEP
jgi:hypothetical protein